jgi:hypothetical protein
MKTHWILLTAFASLPFLAGCSSFNREWKTALRQPLPSSDISGPWEGKWISEKNGHNGRLRCVMTHQGDHQYLAHYHAVFWKIFHSTYAVPLEVNATSTNFVFSGESDLGKLSGGVYTYQGSATPEHFSSTYKSKYDHGRFEMNRPAPK